MDQYSIVFARVNYGANSRPRPAARMCVHIG